MALARLCLSVGSGARVDEPLRALVQRNAPPHSQTRFVTPAQRHRGEDRVILDQHDQVYAPAKNGIRSVGQERQATGRQ
jgi:hypothetical protein